MFQNSEQVDQKNVFKIVKNTEKGRCLHADGDFHSNSEIFSEKPDLFYQLQENRKQIQVCEFCLNLVGSLESQLLHVSKSSANIKLQLPLIDEDQQMLSEELVFCDECNEIYCCEDCKKQAWEQYHCVNCPGKNDSGGYKLWKKFTQHAEENQEVFYLAAKTISKLCALLQQGKNEIAQKFKNDVDSLCWDYSWHIVAIPDDVDEDDEDNYRAMLKSMVQDSLNLLTDFLNFKSESIPVMAQEWLALEGYGRLLGSFTQNAICIAYPNPLAEYLKILGSSSEAIINEELESIFRQWFSIIESNEQLSEYEDDLGESEDDEREGAEVDEEEAEESDFTKAGAKKLMNEKQFNKQDFDSTNGIKSKFGNVEDKLCKVNNQNQDQEFEVDNKCVVDNNEKFVDKQNLRSNSNYTLENIENCNENCNGSDKKKAADQQTTIQRDKNGCATKPCLYEKIELTNVVNGTENGLDIKSVISKCKGSCEGLVGSGIFKVLSCVNHSCVPNASVEFLNWQKVATLLATRHVSQGEEVTISYIDAEEYDQYLDRVNELKEYNFMCDCKRCEEECFVQPKRRKVGKV